MWALIRALDRYFLAPNFAVAGPFLVPVARVVIPTSLKILFR